MGYKFRGNDFTEPAYMSEPLPESDNCGTRAGYRKHANHGEPQCDDCQQAHNDYMREYMRGYRARKRVAA